MAGRIRNRLDLRRQAEAAELRGPRTTETTPDATRGTAARRPRTARSAGRTVARWGVFDGAMKLVAAFDYKERALADQKAAELNEKRNGTYLVQMVKEEVFDTRDDD